MASRNKLHFPVFPATSEAMWLFKSRRFNWKWYIKLPVNILKNKGLPLCWLPPSHQMELLFWTLMWSFTLRLAEQQNGRCLGHWHCTNTLPNLVYCRALGWQGSTVRLFQPLLCGGFSHLQTNLTVNNINYKENERLQWGYEGERVLGFATQWK